MLIALANANIFTGEELLRGKALLIEQGKILGLVNNDAVPSHAAIQDCKGQYLAPGLIDLQIYGGGGCLFSDHLTAAALHGMADSLALSGTTAFLLTLATNSMEVFEKAIAVVKANPHPALLGLHFEGPYLNPLKKGAHLNDYIKKPQRQEVELLLKKADGCLKMITLAPEICDPQIIRLLTENGVVVSAGHSNATFSEAVQSFEQGVTAVTHLFNAMSPFHHRDTGLPGAVFCTPGVSASIIADGIHVDYHALAVAKQVLQERLFLITDAVEESKVNGYTHVRHADRFTLPDGTLSGSNLTLLQAVRNCTAHAGIDREEALRMASGHPAQVLQTPELGRLAPGYAANLLVLDRQLALKEVYLKGISIKNSRYAI
jgi:N-acetylglucosamine-6-phosphate deacetylase